MPTDSLDRLDDVEPGFKPDFDNPDNPDSPDMTDNPKPVEEGKDIAESSSADVADTEPPASTK